jgi:lysophospholipase
MLLATAATAAACSAESSMSDVQDADTGGKADEADEDASEERHLTWGRAAALRDVSELPATADELYAGCHEERGHVQDILCWFHDTGSFDSFEGQPDEDGQPVEIHYAAFEVPDERAALVIVTGRSETYAKYAEVVHDIVNVNGDLGYSVYLIDHRGQGFSQRLLEDPERGYVDEFDDYVLDLRTFVNDVVQPQTHERVFGVAHSMGGGIMTRYLQQFHAADQAFDAVILSSPMHGIADLDRRDTGGPLGWSKELGSLELLRGLLFFGLGERYVPGGGPYDPQWGEFEGDEGNSVTHSIERHMVTRYVYNANPQTPLGSATVRWAVEAYDAAKAMKTDPASQDVDIPVLLLSAGQEQIVSNPDQQTACDNMPACQLELVPGARHELMFEVDEIRTPVLDRMVNFFEANLE